MGLVKLLPRLVVKLPRPRDTLNDDDEFTTPSPRTFALRPGPAAVIHEMARAAGPMLASQLRQAEGPAEMALAPPRDRDRRVREAEHLVCRRQIQVPCSRTTGRAVAAVLSMDQSIVCRLPRARDRTQRQGAVKNVAKTRDD